MEKFKIAAIQMDIVRGNAKLNIEKALGFIDRAVKKNAKIICFPELFTTGFDYGYIKSNAEAVPNKLTEIIGKIAHDSGACIIAGSIPEKRNGILYNTSLLFGTGGGIIGKYSKMHLFPLMEEDRHFSRGKEAQVFDTVFGKLGIIICYDLRFPEIARKLTLSGAEIIFMPSEFPYPRLEHWKTLIRARAIENQVYFVGVNRVGNDGTSTFFGNTSVVDPWGEVIATSGEDECVVIAEVDISRVYEVREKIPCLKDIHNEFR